ncbi:hypothetical protein U9M48_037925 [Paspalum notatum var. saurae]|uniref:Uncharacterized protein n=1 Tax=Paspalum notatum var. saurae TaxID=547442 RepID=A0AAQ3UG16_PASNO
MVLPTFLARVSFRRPHLTSRPRKLTLARKVWSSSSVPVLAEGLVIIRSKKRVELANEVTSVGIMLLYFCKSFGCHEL